MRIRTEYTPTIHDAENGTTFVAPVVPADEVPWELHSWQLDARGKIIAVWGRTTPRKR